MRVAFIIALLCAACEPAVFIEPPAGYRVDVSTAGQDSWRMRIVPITPGEAVPVATCWVAATNGSSEIKICEKVKPAISRGEPRPDGGP